MKRLVLTSLAAVTIAGGCTRSDTVVGTQFFRPAGTVLDGGEFGNATANNMAVQRGQGGPMFSLAKRFAAEVPNTVNFAFNDARLNDGARATLRQQAGWIRQFPEMRFRVFGYTDLVGSAAYNKRLGMRRARAVVTYLASQGISRSRLEAVVSFGETRPLIAVQGRERQNRRAVTEVTGFVSNHPTVLDGKYAQIIARDYVISAKPASDLRTLNNAQIEQGG